MLTRSKTPLHKRKANDNDVDDDAYDAPDKPQIESSRARQRTKGRLRTGLSQKGEARTAEKDAPSPVPTAVTTAATPSPCAGHCPAARQYWLLKAEPESRVVKGHDIKFSIDDLAAQTAPEPWDGVRNYAARNHLRAMRRGDLAFFYHSSCKEPAIVGVMEIVAEHTPDLSAHNPDAPYYDPKDDPANPRWSVVHVNFRQKLQVPITLKELKAWHAQKNHILSNLQLLRLARLSVSKVEEEEWEFLLAEMEKRGDRFRP
ncbi:hypothetical protein K3495_g3939 [Podosphaera aphanis]|nr:hypothetical protein K3495_g3939 [Podosphaera aphanis]